MAVETKPLHGIKRVPQCNYIGRQYNIGEKPSIILYTFLSFLCKSPGLQCSNMILYGLREVKVKFNQYWLFVIDIN